MRDEKPPLEAERRFLTYVLMMTIVLPRVLLHGTLSDGATILIVWSALGILLTRPSSRIPRAIVWDPRDTRQRRCRTILERLGRAPFGYGVRGTLPWAPRSFDTPTTCDLGEDFSAPMTKRSHPEVARSRAGGSHDGNHVAAPVTPSRARLHP